MTIAAEDLERRLAGEAIPEPGRTGDGTDPSPDPGAPVAREEGPELRLPLVAGAALLSSLAGAWMVGGLFRGSIAPRGAGVLGVVIGVGMAWISARSRRGAMLQAATVPVAAVAGAALVAPSATGGTANLPGLVADALRGGGLLQPPVPFEPGWRFLAVVLFAAVGAAAVGLSVSLGRPRLAVAVPVPILLGAALLQPEGAELVTSGVAGLMAMAALALAYGADLPRGEGAGAQFETRRLARGAALLVVLVVALSAVARAGFLFPEPDKQQVIPPQRPPTPPAEPDRVLFSVADERPGPWRVGVLDEYDGEAFLLPSIDPSRIEPAGDGPLAERGNAETYTVSFTIADVRGATLPAPPSPISVEGSGEIEYDPRTQVLRLASGRPSRGYRYQVTAPSMPDGRALAEAPVPVDAAILHFTDAPPAPNEVLTLLAEAPAQGFDRLQFIRQRLYNNIVAAGGGKPVPVPPSRVAQMLQPGAEATPYEITAAEVLLARWAGVPARLGFGFYGGEQAESGRDFRPRHGAAWLEAWFEGHGWVPLVGTPPRAKASLSEQEKNEDPNVLATQELALVVFVPVRLATIELLYRQVRYWAGIVLPLLLLAGLIGGGWPVAAKALRRWQRQRWAADRGPAARIWSAYIELRDRAHDLNIGDVRTSPLEFLESVESDAEHEELAWLVTRAVWGDLRRDLRDEDADAAEEMARSVGRRLAGAQTAMNRLLGAVSKASLTEPYNHEVPGIHLSSPPPVAPGASTVQRLRRRALRPSTAFALVVAIAIVAAPFVVPEQGSTAELPSRYPARVVPDRIGNYEFVREADIEDRFGRPGADALVSGGHIHTIRTGTLVAGSHQVAVFEPEIDARSRRVQAQVERSILSGTFVTRRMGPVRLRELHTAEQQVYLWFPPTTNTMQLWVMRADVPDGRDLVERVISYQLGLPEPRPAGEPS